MVIGPAVALFRGGDGNSWALIEEGLLEARWAGRLAFYKVLELAHGPR